MRIFSFLFIQTFLQQYCLAQRIDSIVPKMRQVFIKAIPNPIQHKLVLEAKNFAAGIVIIQIVDAKGSSIYNDKRLVVSVKDAISIYIPFKPGTYWAIAKQKDKMAKCSFMEVP